MAASPEKADNRPSDSPASTAQDHVKAGLALQKKGQFAAAIKSYEQALALDANHVSALTLCGVAYAQNQDIARAKHYLDKAYALAPNSPQVSQNYSHLLTKIGNHKKALEVFEAGAPHMPNNAGFYIGYGHLLRQNERLEESQAAYQTLIDKYPHAKGEGLAGLGLLALAKKPPQRQAAIDYFEKAIASTPTPSAEWHSHLGVVYENLGNIEAAEKSLGLARHLDPHSDQIKFNHSNVLLWLGRYKEGWQAYEARSFSAAWRGDFQLTDIISQLPFPAWKGEPLQGKSILVFPEQGLGDVLNFLRFLAQLEARGARVAFAMRAGYEPILPLLNSFGERFEIIDIEKPFYAFDYHTYLLSQALMFKVFSEDKIPPPLRFLVPEARQQKWHKIFKKYNLDDAPKIGFTFSGSGLIGNRDTAPEDWQDFFHQGHQHGYQFISLQKSLRPKERKFLDEKADFFFFGNEIDDFADVAAMIDQCDYVITVDSAVAHLAGSQMPRAGQHFLIVPPQASWRWLLGRDDTPWYPNTKLIRQKSDGDWQSVFSALGQRIYNNDKN